MNILLVNLRQDFQESEQQTLFLAQALSRRPECRAVLACHEGSRLHQSALQAGLEVFTLTDSGWGKLAGALKLNWFFRRNPGQWVVHTHDNSSARLGAKVVRKHKNFSLINSRHTPEPLSNGKLEDKFRLADAVACETQEIAYIMAEGKVTPRALKVVRAGLDPACYSPRLPRNDNRIILACTGQLLENKGHALLIRALTTFRNTSWLPPWELRFTGGGPQFQALLELARELGVAHHLAILGGQEPKVVLPDCDILIAPASGGEGCSMSILEAWAVGLPVICSDIMAHQEIAQDSHDCVFFRNGDHGDLAAKMLRLCRDADLRAQLADNGKNSMQKYTHEIMADNYLGMYRRVLGQ